MKLFTLLFSLLLSTVVKAQDVEMADTFRSDGKIYVVVAVACIVLLVISVYIIGIDRRLRKTEQRIKNNTSVRQQESFIK